MSPPKQTTSRIVIMPFRATCFKIAFHFSLLCSPRVLNGDLDFSSFLVHTLTIKFALMNTKLAHFIASRKVRKEGSLAERVMGIGKEQNFCGRALGHFSFFPYLSPFCAIFVFIYHVLASVSLFRKHLICQGFVMI